MFCSGAEGREGRVNGGKHRLCGKKRWREGGGGRIASFIGEVEGWVRRPKEHCAQGDPEVKGKRHTHAHHATLGRRRRDEKDQHESVTWLAIIVISYPSFYSKSCPEYLILSPYIQTVSLPPVIRVYKGGIRGMLKCNGLFQFTIHYFYLFLCFH